MDSLGRKYDKYDSTKNWSRDEAKSYKRKSFSSHNNNRSNDNAYDSSASKRRRYNRRSLPSYDHNSQDRLNIKESQLTDCSSGVGFVDTHCHLDFLFRRLKFFGSFAAFKLKCEYSEKFPANFEGAISIFCEPVTFYKKHFWENLLRNTSLWSAFGCHPHFADTFNKDAEDLMHYALKHEKVIALGEIGLDYSFKNKVPKEVQKNALKNQIKMAIAYKKPIIIHCRDAHVDCLQICKEYIPSDYPIHRHCFTDSWTEASEWMAAFPKLKFGFTCLILKKNLDDLRQVVRQLPIDKILMETDAPYFKPNFLTKIEHAHPGMAIFVAQEVANIKERTMDDVLIQIRKNTRAIYSI